GQQENKCDREKTHADLLLAVGGFDRRLRDAARARDVVGEPHRPAHQPDIARTGDGDVGLVLGGRLDAAAAGDLDRELPRRDLGQLGAARARDGDAETIDRALAAQAAAAGKAEGELRLAEILQVHPARARQADAAKGLAWQRDLDVARGAEPAA